MDNGGLIFLAVLLVVVGFVLYTAGARARGVAFIKELSK